MKTLIRRTLATLALVLGSLAAAQTHAAGVAQDIEEIVVVASSPAFELAQQIRPWLLRDLDTRILAGVEALHGDRYKNFAATFGPADEKFAEMIARQWQRWVSEETL